MSLPLWLSKTTNFCSYKCRGLNKQKFGNENRECEECLNTFLCNLSSSKKYCSHKCYSNNLKKRELPNLIPGGHRGYFHTEEWKKNMSVKLTGRKIPSISGENHWAWKKDRSLLAKRQQRGDSSYREWRNQVWLRDDFTCKIANPDCNGKIEAHHILGWAKFPELRYQLNNGITLCHAHHPRKRAEEERLSPYFKELVSVTSE